MPSAREEIIKLLESFFEKNADRFSLEIAILYGSWARGYPRLDSDIDLAVLFSSPEMVEEAAYKNITNLSLVLSMELKKEVNILQIHEDQWKPVLYYNAIVLGIPVYIKNGKKYFKVRNEAIFQMEDFSIFGIGWQIKAAAKNLEALKNA